MTGFLLGALIFSGGNNLVGGGGGQFVELFRDRSCKKPIAISVNTISSIYEYDKNLLRIRSLDNSFWLCKSYKALKEENFKK